MSTGTAICPAIQAGYYTGIAFVPLGFVMAIIGAVTGRTKKEKPKNRKDRTDLIRLALKNIIGLVANQAFINPGQGSC